MSKTLLGQDRGYVPQPAPYEYRPQSIFVRNKAVTLVFVLLAISLGTYVWKSLHAPRRVAPPVHSQAPLPAPVYIEPIAPPAAPRGA